jgi:hypothetical protein
MLASGQALGVLTVRTIDNNNKRGPTLTGRFAVVLPYSSSKIWGAFDYLDLTNHDRRWRALVWIVLVVQFSTQG